MSQRVPAGDHGGDWGGQSAPRAWCGVAAGSGAALAAVAGGNSWLLLAIGCILFGATGFLPADRRRMLGLTVYGWLVLSVAGNGVAFGGQDVVGMVLVGGGAAWVIVPIVRARFGPCTGVGASSRRWIVPLALEIAAGLFVGAAAGRLAGLAGTPPRAATAVSLALFTAGVNAAFLFAAVKRYGREGVELAVETAAWPMYRFRVLGPGVESFPLVGPIVLIANHAAWFDPLWIGKVVPRRITPMMNSMYYDLPVIRWLMRHVIDAIRVQESNYRRSVPEIDEAVRRLDRGECLLIFPESYLRRSENQLLRRFAQGIYRILLQRPDVPVVPCWIEGGWGSFTSHRNGPPGVGKPFDWGRPITVVIGVGECVAASTLQDKIRTRRCLEERVLGLRRYLMSHQRSRVAGATACRPSAGPLPLDRKETA